MKGNIIDMSMELNSSKLSHYHETMDVFGGGQLLWPLVALLRGGYSLVIGLDRGYRDG